jgi:hypothetical protein
VGERVAPVGRLDERVTNTYEVLIEQRVAVLESITYEGRWAGA